MMWMAEKMKGMEESIQQLRKNDEKQSRSQEENRK